MKRLGLAIAAAALLLVFEVPMVSAACRPEPVTPNTPTGIAGCERWGRGVATHYGPGDGVAMNFCTWVLRHEHGCGTVKVAAVDTGLVVTVPVIDFGDLYTGTPDERIIDLQYGVVAALGLPLSAGKYDVIVCPVTAPHTFRPAACGGDETTTMPIPDTATAP